LNYPLKNLSFELLKFDLLIFSPVNNETDYRSALQIALEKKNFKMIKILLQFGAHLSLKKMPDNIVNEVVKGGHIQIVDQLLATGLVPSNHFLQFK
jgi:hypothetical protein